MCLSLSIPNVVPPGPGFWKLNTSVLNDPEYVALISDAWSSWRRSISRFPSLVKWWDAGKSLVKGLTIRFCCLKSSARSGLRDLLVRLIDHLKSKVDLGSSSCLGPYHSALAELAAMDFQAARGTQVRSRAKWVEEGESSSAYFLHLGRKHGSDRWISALRDGDGSIVSSPPDLCASLSSFYSDLFSASSVDPQVQADLLENLSSSLSGGQSSLCEGHLTVDEVLSALRGMARRKAPGLDGLPMEFYLKFWPVVGADLVSVLNSCCDSGSLSQRRGVISLSFKKGDRLDPRNWRPITLLNVNYKLASRAIAGRLLKVIHLLGPNIYNGLRHYRGRISKPIPSFLRFGKFQVFVKHSGQVPTCHKCNCAGHFSNVCPNHVCFNCEGLGHEARDCPCPVLCCICKEEGHLGINCTYSWVCSTVSPTDEQDDVAVESDDDDGLSHCSYGRSADYLLPASPLIS